MNESKIFIDGESYIIDIQNDDYHFYNSEGNPVSPNILKKIYEELKRVEVNNYLIEQSQALVDRQLEREMTGSVRRLKKPENGFINFINIFIISEFISALFILMQIILT